MCRLRLSQAWSHILSLTQTYIHTNMGARIEGQWGHLPRIFNEIPIGIKVSIKMCILFGSHI